MRSLVCLLLCGLVALGGCSVWDLQARRAQSPDEQDLLGGETREVGDLAVPFGMFPVQVEGVGLVVGLPGTGCDPKPSPLRAALLGEMQTRGVEHPNAILARADTALVKVRGVLKPGIQRGDRFDVEVRIPSQSETTSLRGGRLLEVRLSELAVLDGQVHSGDYLARAQGAIMVDPSAEEADDGVLLGRGRVLGGGVALKNRPLALVLRPERQSVLNSARIETAVNKRFHSFHRGVKVGVAKAKTDEYIELTVHPRYRHNIHRYVGVVRSLVLRENESEQMLRLAKLQKQLLDPVTSSKASLRLEAVGTGGVDALKKGIEAPDPEVRFYAAESLAYLDQPEAVDILADTARQMPVFRVFALTALSAMDELSAHDRLREMLGVTSTETRDGAFRALWAMNPDDALIRGDGMNAQFSFHVLDVAGPPLIHVTRSRRPEVVLFGRDQRFACPVAIEAGTEILVRGTKAGEISVSKYTVDEADQKRIVSDRVDDVVRAIVDLGGTYPDVVQALQAAKASGALSSRFAVDALPEAGRTYDRVATSDEEEPEQSQARPNSPMPDLFTAFGGKKTSPAREVDKNEAKPLESEEEPAPSRGFFGKIMGPRSG